jgi:hypothetical protein
VRPDDLLGELNGDAGCQEVTALLERYRRRRR